MIEDFIREQSRQSKPESETYDIMAAMRGPDVGGGTAEVIKLHVTARIRHIVFGDNGNHMIAYHDHCYTKNGSYYCKQPLTNEQVTLVSKAREALRYECVGGHFVVHLMKAVKATKDHPVWGGLADKLIAIL